MKREIKDIGALNTFILHDNKESIPKDYKFTPVHFVFDVKYNGRRRARLVDRGRLINPYMSEICSGVVSIKYVRLILLLADHNDLEVITVDIGNAYLHGQTRGKLYIKIESRGIDLK